MAELELVGFNDILKALEAPQTAGDWYVARRKLHLEDELTTDNTIDGRFVGADGAKLDFVIITGPVDLDAIQLAMDNLTAAVILKGTWDPTTGQFPVNTGAGETWISTGIATIDGVDFKVDDRITALVDGASLSVYDGQWLRGAYSDLVTSVSGRVGAITLTEADITDLKAYLANADIDTLDKLNTIVTDATLINRSPPSLVAATTYDVLSTDSILHVIYTATGACAITIPTAEVSVNRFFTIKNAGGSYAITVDCEGAELIDGDATLIITGSYDAVNLYSDGTNWFIY
jgi:hypothetical protein